MKVTRITYAFIDSQNLNLGIRSLGWKLDFKKFHRYLVDKWKVNKVYLFLGYIPKFESMYTRLRSFGSQIIFKPVVGIGENKTKGNVDAELVLHSAKILFPMYDRAVFISGDGDFLCLYDELDKDNKLERLLIPSRKSESSLLYKYRDRKVYLEDLRGKLELGGGLALSTRLRTTTPS
ncbi:NYN domain-containing protein [Candidatus Dojkabacteria bacterium]|nr:NYN domain-containing protein [Candidatus Dojkabacteria bacterium]